MENLDRASTVWQEPLVNVFRAFKVDQFKCADMAGAVGSAVDKTIGRKVFQLSGSVPAANYLRVPKSKSASLNLVGRYVYVQFKAPRRAASVYAMHFDVRTQDGLTLRISLSNMYSEIKVSPSLIQLPTGHIPGGKWTVLVLDAAAVLDMHSTRVYHSLKAIQLCSTLLVRNVFTSYNIYSPTSLPRDMALPLRPGRSWHDLYTYDRLPVPVGVAPEDFVESGAEIPLSRPVPPAHPRTNVPAASSADGASASQRASETDGGSGGESWSPQRSGPRSGAAAPMTPVPIPRVEALASPARARTSVRNNIPVNAARTAAAAAASAAADSVEARRAHAKSLMATIIPRETMPEPSVESIMAEPDPMCTLASVIGYSGSVPSSCLWSADGSEAVYSAVNMVVATRVCASPAAAASHQRYFTGHTAPVVALALSGDGRLLASAQGGSEPIIRVWDFATGTSLAVLLGHHRDVSALTLSRTGARLAGVGKAKSGKTKLVVWDISSLSALAQGGIASVVATAHVDPHVGVIKFSPFGDDRLVSCGLNNVRFWRLKAGVLRSCPVSLGAHTGHLFTDLAFEVGHLPPAAGGAVLDDEAVLGQRVYVASDSGMVFQIAYSTVELEAIYQLHNGPIRSLSVVDGYCVSGSDDGFLRVWPLDFSDFFLEAEHESAVTSVAISYDCLKILCGTAAGSLGALDILTQSFTTFLRSHTAGVHDLAVSPKDDSFATVAGDGSVRLWSLPDCQQLLEFTAPGDVPHAVAFHPTGGYVAVGFESGWMRVFELESAELAHEFKQHTARIGKLAYTPDAAALFSASADGTIVKYAVDSLYQPTQFIAHGVVSPSGELPMAVSADGGWLAYAGPSHDMVTLAETESLQAIHVITLHTQAQALHFPRALSHELLISTVDSYLFRADASRGELVAGTPMAHSGLFSALDVTANGQYIASGGHDGVLKVWDYYQRAAPGAQSFVNAPGYLSGVAFACGDSLVVSAGAGGAVFVWRFHGDTTSEFRARSEAQLEALATERSASPHALSSSASGSLAGSPARSASGSPTPGREHGAEAAGVVEDDDPTFGDVAIKVASAFSVDPRREHTLPTRLAEERYTPPDANEAALSPRLLLGYSGSISGTGGHNVVWCEAGGYVAYASGAAVVLEDLASKAQTHLWGHTAAVSVVAVSPDGSLVASAPGTSDVDGAARILVWSAVDAVCQMSLAFHEAGVVALAFSPSGEYLVSVGSPGERSVAVWDLRSCAMIGSVVLEQPQLWAAWSPTANPPAFVTGGVYSLTSFTIEGGARLAEPRAVALPASLGTSIFTAGVFDSSPRRVSRMARRIYVGTYSGEVAVFNTCSEGGPSFLGSWRVVSSEHPLAARQVTVLGWRADVLFTGDMHGKLAAWALPEDPMAASVGGSRIEELTVGDAPLVALSASALGDDALVGSGDGNLWFVNWPELTAVRLLSAHSDSVTAVSFAEDDALLVSGSRDGSVRLWSHGRGAGPWEGVVQFQVASPFTGVTCLVASKVRSAVVAGYSDGCVRVFDLRTLSLVGLHKAFSDAPVTAVAVGGIRDSAILAGSGNGDVVVLDTGNGAVLKRIGEHAGARIDCIDVSSLDPQLWLVGSADRRVSVWRTRWRSDKYALVDWLTFAAPPIPEQGATGAAEGNAAGRAGAPTLAVFSPVEPDMIVYSGYGDAPAILLYSLVHEEVLRSLPLGRDQWPLTLSVVATGRTPMVAIGLAERVLKLVDYWEGTFQDFVGHSGAVGAVAVTDSGSALVSGSSCGDICVWDVTA
ncbi:WD repeat-containing protein 90 [Thecamonas trahens ATCC 50062]|uniref:WD repeat-containing protein 90 n=1 Tax=Thecamonas trahens ATCC 50062 TaxID=461836 RepID=A0A0L0D4U4_THETB|nr:WD repeat-containing protein 90 [Thecamonas trahens ATCC 50062]KNC47081.1 WD repeat-containing protein 90 [Thecamonas trahens ATCC 50062]|eukprot:XP_013759861.1 WD repeat-containing protein 90 [Thecamonas trahens ATCC 50062]